MREIRGGAYSRARKSSPIHRASGTEAAAGEAMRRLQLQMVFVLVAAILVTILSAILISSAIRGAERVVVGDTRRALDAADAELALQYSYRVNTDSGWDQLPASARDISLRAISQATLRSYPGVEGGFYAG